MEESEYTIVWVFLGEGGIHSAAVFSEREIAEMWIAENELSGTLTAYELDTPVYDWAIGRNFFKPTKAHQRSSEFIGRFSSAYAEHYHYANGKCDEQEHP
ncbi:DUF7710 domain-containing protein [Stratiformator vulcanicus]|uniref:DUF7710 domain-containing protein n=1 Tax=Stratiformator vulcanicus TaxID=2527980 RepID=A0A517QWT5_9PLAN|nr:hypothetical protein [Stratiformator vulcanicus]QDT36043.1 hypothetical protein Pan189_03980 [Stratiformator vulcanicus]